MRFLSINRSVSCLLWECWTERRRLHWHLSSRYLRAITVQRSRRRDINHNQLAAPLGVLGSLKDVRAPLDFRYPFQPGHPHFSVALARSGPTNRQALFINNSSICCLAVSCSLCWMPVVEALVEEIRMYSHWIFLEGMPRYSYIKSSLQSFSVSRLITMAEGFVEHCLPIFRDQSMADDQRPEEVQKILSTLSSLRDDQLESLTLRVAHLRLERIWAEQTTLGQSSLYRPPRSPRVRVCRPPGPSPPNLGPSCQSGLDMRFSKRLPITDILVGLTRLE